MTPSTEIGLTLADMEHQKVTMKSNSTHVELTLQTSGETYKLEFNQTNHELEDRHHFLMAMGKAWDKMHAS